jgi:hypothetical protein
MIDEISEKISAGQFEFSKHAVDQSILREVNVAGHTRADCVRGNHLKIIQMTNTGPAA